MTKAAVTCTVDDNSGGLARATRNRRMNDAGAGGTLLDNLQVTEICV